MRICTDEYMGSDATNLIIRLRTTNKPYAINRIKPDIPSYTVGELMQSNRAELIFDDSRDLDTFIEALLQLQKKYRENVGEWRVMR